MDTDEIELPLVSIVVPMYNAEHTIERAIRSCLHQTMPELEVIVADDGSTDGSREVVAAIDDRRVRLLPPAPNHGPGDARNYGLENALGQWLTVLDADDAYLPHRLHRLLEVVESFDDPLCVVVDRWLVEVQNSAGAFVSLDRKPPRRPSTPLEVLSANEAVRRRVGGKPFYSRTLLDLSQARYPSGVRYGEDTAFLIQLLNVPGGRLARVSDALYRYTYRPGSLTGATNRLTTWNERTHTCYVIAP